jgi:hypothetical protein
MFKLLWDEINTPSGRMGPLTASYFRAVVAIGHAVLGAAFAALLGVWGLAPALVIGLVYWLAKEEGDIKRGGKVWDGVEDALMVAMGAWYGAVWWPVLILCSAAYIMVVDAWRRKA